MQHSKDSFQSADGLKQYYQTWRPDKTPKAVVQIIHGFGE